MATQSLTIHMRHSKETTVFSELVYRVRLAHYRYELETGLYIMSTAEKCAFNLLALSTGLLVFYAMYYYLPATEVLSPGRLVPLFTSHPKLQAHGIDIALEIMENPGEVIANLNKQMNASVAL